MKYTPVSQHPNTSMYKKILGTEKGWIYSAWCVRKASQGSDVLMK